MHYVMLFGAIIIEVIASSMLEYSEGFTKPGPSILCMCLYAVSAFLLARALLKIDLGIAYATWCSLGIIAIFLSRPKTSQNAIRINFTSSSRTYSMTSAFEYLMIKILPSSFSWISKKSASISVQSFLSAQK